MRLTPALRLSPTDLSNFHSCRHRTGLDLGRAAGELEYPEGFDGMANRLAALGEAHERQYVDTLRAQGLSVVDLRPLRERKAPEDEIVAATLQAMRGGAEVIVQAALRHENWFGYADVLRRVETPSDLGSFSYEAHDAKLARETKAGTILQLSVYSELIAAIQGAMPEHFCVVTPLGIESEGERYRFAATEAVYRRVRRRFLDAVAEGWPVLVEREYPEPVPACEVCAWWRRCNERRRADDHLSFIAGVTRVQRVELEENDIDTLAAAAALAEPLPWKPARGSREAYLRTAGQARLQVATRTSEPWRIAREFLPVVPEAGLCLLPEPSPADLFLDFEGDPFGRREGGGREYLTGLGWRGEQGFEYQARWAFDDAAEREAFEATIDRVIERLSEPGNEGLHVYHFGHYEPSALKRLMGRHATRGEELDRLLRGGRFVDLHRVVRGALRAGVESYSIKELEALTGFERTVKLDDARRTLRAVERCLEDGAADRLAPEDRAAVEGYNRDDCSSTEALRDWLEALRKERVAAGEDVPRPVVTPEKELKPPTELDLQTQAWRDRLLGEGVDPSRKLLADLLDFHRREEKAGWWEFFRLRDLSPDELLEEGEAIVGLERIETQEAGVARFRYPFQEMNLGEGDKLRIAAEDGKAFGEIVAVDRIAGTVDIAGKPARSGPTPTAVFAHNAFNNDAMRRSLLFLTQQLFSDGNEHPCGLRLLRRQIRSPENRDALAWARGLDGDVLAIQGPPGAGKTHLAAELIVALVGDGRRVGVTAVSHKVIVNLLQAVQRETSRRGERLRLGRKVNERSDEPVEGIEEVTDNQAFAQLLSAGGFDVAGATKFFWSRPEAQRSVDFLFVDEAGQMSLADTLAASPAARNLVLLGDPQQLDQPQKAVHPDGVDVSALGHLLGEAATMPPERGIFLEETWRLAPPLCELTSELFYDRQLRSIAGLEQQRLIGTRGFDDAGLWWCPIEHAGRTNWAGEEVEAVASVVSRLLVPGARWVDRHGSEHPLTASDVLVVGPFNAHVTRLIERLPAVRIGTVDKFQGQEAPVVIYTMATSSAEDAPRGMEFLFSANRFNVATSRARCAVIVVASPKLLDADCRTPRQMQLANALCRFVEQAQRAPTHTDSDRPPDSTRR